MTAPDVSGATAGLRPSVCDTCKLRRTKQMRLCKPRIECLVTSTRYVLAMSAIILYWRKNESGIVYCDGGYCTADVYVFDGCGMTPEGAVKKQVRKILDAHGVYYFFPATHGYGRSGVPDVVCCHRGRFIGIECKAGRGVPTPLQQRELRKIEEAGGVALVVNEANLDELERVLERC